VHDHLDFEKEYDFEYRAHTAGPKAIYTASLLGQEEGPTKPITQIEMLKDALGLPAQLR